MSIPPVVKTVRVGLPPHAAFELFTARIGEWWPVETHSVSGNAGHVSRDLRMDDGIGGELVEIGHDGARHVWGRIDEWAPGDALALTWHPGRNDDLETRVRVTFEADGEGSKVTLTHSDWEVLGRDGQTTREGYASGWVGVLERFTDAA